MNRVIQKAGQVFNDRNGKFSSKRVVGTFGFVSGIFMAGSMIIFKAVIALRAIELNVTRTLENMIDVEHIYEIDSGLIIGIVSASAGLLASSNWEKAQNNNI